MPSESLVLLEAGALLGAVLVGQIVGRRHLAVDSVPVVLRGRVEFSNRLRPWLMVAAGALLLAGLLLAA